MTVQAGIELDLDIAAMVGEMEAPPCESLGHRTDSAHFGEATHYARVCCPSCDLNVIKSYCKGMVQMVAEGRVFSCHDCGFSAVASDIITILAPIR